MVDRFEGYDVVGIIFSGVLKTYQINKYISDL